MHEVPGGVVRGVVVEADRRGPRTSAAKIAEERPRRGAAAQPTTPTGRGTSRTARGGVVSEVVHVPSSLRHAQRRAGDRGLAIAPVDCRKRRPAGCAEPRLRATVAARATVSRSVMKLVVQVPCLNEEETLPSVLQSIPRSIDGIDEIVIVVIDDGSHRPDGRGGPVARRHPLRPARPQPGPGPLVPGRRQLRAGDRGRHRRQHRRRQPVPAGADRRPRPPDRRGPRRHRDRGPSGRTSSSTSRPPRRRCRSSAAGWSTVPPGPSCPTPPAGSGPTRARA